MFSHYSDEIPQKKVKGELFILALGFKGIQSLVAEKAWW